MKGVARWNYHRLVDLKEPSVILPAVFDPALMVELNSASKRVTGQEKYPKLNLSDRDTGERFGLKNIVPSCRPVPLDWDKHRTQKREVPTALVPLPPVQTPTTTEASETAASSSSTLLLSVASPRAAPCVGDLLSAGALLKQDMPPEDLQPLDEMQLIYATPLPLRASPRCAHTGPVKTGFCVRPHTLDATHERSNRQLVEEVPWGEGHPKACG